MLEGKSGSKLWNHRMWADSETILGGYVCPEYHSEKSKMRCFQITLCAVVVGWRVFLASRLACVMCVSVGKKTKQDDA